MRRLCERADTEIAGLYTRDPDSGKQVLTDLGLPATLLVNDYQALLDNAEIDAVFLVSPNSYHGAQALAAMNAGKHVFCEKPAATSYGEYCQLLKMEKAHPELITFVDYILHFDSMENHLQKMVADGNFGAITQIQVNYRHPINISGNKAWKLDKAIMGDAIGMGIIHALFVLVFAIRPQARPVSVFAISQPAQVRGFEADAIWNILIRFDNGATGFCFGNIDTSNGYDAQHNLSGTAGGFVFDSGLDRPQKVRYWSDSLTEGKWIYPLDARQCESVDMAPRAWPEDTTTPDSGDVMEHQTDACVAHFIDCIKAKEQSPLSFCNSADVTDIGWAAQMSAVMKQEIALPLDRELAGEFFQDR
jgi:predicted dehydrogenase